MSALTVLLPEPVPVAPTLRELALEYACRSYDVSVAEVKGPRKYRHLTYARALFVRLVKGHRPEVSYGVIGRWIGRDHSTIIHLTHRGNELAATDEEFAQECARFAAFLAQRRSG